MKFKTCVRCGYDKTPSQFSKRITDVCTECLLNVRRRINSQIKIKPITLHIDYTPPKFSIPRDIAKPKLQLKSKKPKEPEVTTFGFKSISTPVRPVIRGGSPRCSDMPEVDRRAIRKAEYRARKAEATREKKLKETR